ncbi:MAG: aminopeptidase [Caldilineaceae bacterium]
MASWSALAKRIVEGINAQPGELILVQDHMDHAELLREVLLAVDCAGATPLIDAQSPVYLNRWLAEASAEAVQQSSHHRLRWMREADRVIRLSGGIPNFALAAPDTLAAWQIMDEELSRLEDSRQLPVLVVAVPTQQMADRVGMPLRQLEDHLLAACLFSGSESQMLIEQVRTMLAGNHIVIGTGNGYELHLDHGARYWHGDDGVIDEADRQRKTIVSNLPAASVYTTVLEDQTHGTLYLPQVGEATQVLFHFEAGRITNIEAANGAEQIAAWLDSYSGETRRISHIGIGLNPHLQQPIGWTIVDEHVVGSLFLALGENRYMGGQNESSLNHDFALHGASLSVDGRMIVRKGNLDRVTG